MHTTTTSPVLFRLTAALMVLLFLSGCGVEAVGAAATGAAVKQKEIEEGKAQQDLAGKQLQQALQQNQQRQQELDNATK